MTEKTIPITLSQEHLEMIDKALRRSPTEQISDEDLSRLVNLGLKHWIDTLFGPKRYRTTTELFLDWLRDIYTTYLLDEDPNERRLFIRMGFPYGQAAYLARVLRYERPTTSRLRGLTQLRNELGKISKTAREWVKKNRGDEKLNITITKAARLELDAILGELIQQGEPVHPIITAGTISDYQHILVMAEDVELIEGVVASILKSMQPEA
jgi:hypothetical protein